jgi:cyclophilin family peptidyl-prolyl cis-trans isomerase
MMHVRGWGGKLAAFAGLGLLAGLSVWGCQKDAGGDPHVDAPRESQPSDSDSAAETDSQHRLRQSFAEATRSDQYSDWEPVGQTMAGKSIGPMFEKVKQGWDGVVLITSDNKKLAYVATLDTEKGPIEITMRPDLAPNHVRSFVSLIQAGYYDGLVFERTVTEQSAEGDVQLIEGGAPDGGINPSTDGIGYWLKPEVSPDAKHEAGAVGAPHGWQADTAACRFYIMISKSPVLDGHWTIFGKVTRGMEVARAIFRQPVKEDIENPSANRPLKPVVIRKVTVKRQEVEGGTN